MNNHNHSIQIKQSCKRRKFNWNIWIV